MPIEINHRAVDAAKMAIIVETVRPYHTNCDVCDDLVRNSGATAAAKRDGEDIGRQVTLCGRCLAQLVHTAATGNVVTDTVELARG